MCIIVLRIRGGKVPGMRLFLRYALLFGMFCFIWLVSSQAAHARSRHKLYMPLVIQYRVPVPTSTPAVPSTVAILSSSTYMLGSSRYIVGEVRNNTGHNVTLVTLAASLHNRVGKQLRSHTGYALLDILKPGQRSPFLILVGNPPVDYADYKLRVQWSVTAEVPLSAVTIRSSGTRLTDVANWRYIIGEVQNDSAGRVGHSKIVVTLYDDGGRVVGVDFTYPTVGPLAAGQRVPFSMLVLAWNDAARYELQTQAELLTRTNTIAARHSP